MKQRKLRHFLVGKHTHGVRRVLLLLLIWVPISVVAFVLFCNLLLTLSTRQYIAKDAQSATPNEVGLVLGTSKKFMTGRANSHFINRMDTAYQLYQLGKVKRLLVSGDNSTKSYNEPNDMRQALIERGIPSDHITRDFAGFRTLDSMVRAKEIFQLSRLTVISDGFHLPRAVFIGRHHGLDVTGVASAKVALNHSLKTEVREYLARVKAVLDLYLLRTPPKFGGDPEPIVVTR